MQVEGRPANVHRVPWGRGLWQRNVLCWLNILLPSACVSNIAMIVTHPQYTHWPGYWPTLDLPRTGTSATSVATEPDPVHKKHKRFKRWRNKRQTKRVVLINVTLKELAAEVRHTWFGSVPFSVILRKSVDAACQAPTAQELRTFAALTCHHMWKDSVSVCAGTMKSCNLWYCHV